MLRRGTPPSGGIFIKITIIRNNRFQRYRSIKILDERYSFKDQLIKIWWESDLISCQIKKYILKFDIASSGGVALSECSCFVLFLFLGGGWVNVICVAKLCPAKPKLAHAKPALPNTAQHYIALVTQWSSSQTCPNPAVISG